MAVLSLKNIPKWSVPKHDFHLCWNASCEVMVMATWQELMDFECGMLDGNKHMGYSISEIASELNIPRSQKPRPREDRYELDRE